MATAKARRKAKHKAARPARAGKGGKARKVPETTVVHVDREVYALLQKERTAEDRGLNAPLRRLLGLGGKAKAARKRLAKAQAPAAAPAPAPEMAQV